MMSIFAQDVIKGLQSQPKYLSSKYFYDEKGDRLFQQIMELDEYYLTRTEYGILHSYKEDILKIFSPTGEPFNLVEFGAGDGYKTKILLRHFLHRQADFDYVPIDISGNVLEILSDSLTSEMPSLHVRPIQNDYFEALKELKGTGRRNIVLFLGSNIGNFTHAESIAFLKSLNDSLSKGDLLFIGFDLKKDPKVILNAYDDSKGVTRDFNLNLLQRINNELDGNFDIPSFKHQAVYNPLTGTTSSYLISTKKQTVEIMDAAILFEPWEAIHMEISQKFDQHMIEELAEGGGFEIVSQLTDEKNYFVNSIWQK